jgi:predicted  nucleic acid-binding Zn-ribbon protein
MNVEQLTDELDSVLQRVQAEVHRDISGARKAAEEQRAEVLRAKAALAQIEDQHKHAQANLAMVMADVDRFSALAAVGHDIARAKADLQTLQGKNAALEISIAALAKQQSEEEHKLLALRNETSRLAGLRSEHEIAIGEVRKKLWSFG